MAYLDIVPFVIVTTLSEKAMRDHLMYIELVKNWISVLCQERYKCKSKKVKGCRIKLTLLRLAVKTTTS